MYKIIFIFDRRSKNKINNNVTHVCNNACFDQSIM